MNTVSSCAIYIFTYENFIQSGVLILVFKILHDTLRLSYWGRRIRVLEACNISTHNDIYLRSRGSSWSLLRGRANCGSGGRGLPSCGCPGRQRPSACEVGGDGRSLRRAAGRGGCRGRL